jgi:hypothetical protein
MYLASHSPSYTLIPISFARILSLSVAVNTLDTDGDGDEVASGVAAGAAAVVVVGSRQAIARNELVYFAINIIFVLSESCELLSYLANWIQDSYQACNRCGRILQLL